MGAIAFGVLCLAVILALLVMPDGSAMQRIAAVLLASVGGALYALMTYRE